MRIGVLSSPDCWHCRDLKRAASGAHEIVAVDFCDLSATVSGGSDGVASSFFANKLDLKSLDRLIVRTMPAGSLEQIVFRMDVLHQLQASGVNVINSPRTVEISVDKYLSLSLLQRAGIRVPPTFASQRVADAMQFFFEHDRDIVMKPIFGSMGRGIIRLRDAAAAERVFADVVDRQQVIYLQRFVSHGDWDLRLLVIDEEVIAMKRTRHGHWLTNIAQGATGTPVQATEMQQQLAIDAARAVGARIAGVDLVHDDAVHLDLVVEVNAAPGWKTLSRISGVDIAQKILLAVADG